MKKETFLWGSLGVAAISGMMVLNRPEVKEPEEQKIYVVESDGVTLPSTKIFHEKPPQLALTATVFISASLKDGK